MMSRVILFFLAIVLFIGCSFNPYLNFCRGAFIDLFMGRQSVGKKIDWDNFTAINLDIGATYKALPNDKEKKDYQEAFIKNAYIGFRYSGGKLDLFTNWRVLEEKDKEVIVVSDYKRTNKTIFITATKTKPSKLIAINWDKP